VKRFRNVATVVWLDPRPYRGLAKVQAQVLLNSIAFNLKSGLFLLPIFRRGVPKIREIAKKSETGRKKIKKQCIV
jgi:hypothetical protein